ncbi:hypothetical protein D9M72_647040 [compost metagenome]
MPEDFTYGAPYEFTAFSDVKALYFSVEVSTIRCHHADADQLAVDEICELGIKKDKHDAIKSVCVTRTAVLAIPELRAIFARTAASRSAPSTVTSCTK